MTTAAAAKPVTRTASRLFLICVAIAYLFWGTAQTLSLKWADSLSASDGHSFYYRALGGLTGRAAPGPSPASVASGVAPRDAQLPGPLYVEVSPIYSFAHPFTQAFFMFCSETTCIIVMLASIAYKKWRSGTLFRRAVTAEEKAVLVVGEDIPLPLNPCVFLLPCGADFIASIVQNVGMMLTYASVYQMLRGATVLWIGVISYFWLHRRFTKVELWGMFTVCIGLTLVGLSGILKSQHSAVHEDSSATAAAKNPLLGNILVISAQVLHAYQGVCQERLIQLYKVPPLMMVGMEGVYGIALSLSLLAFLQLVPMSRWGHNLVGLQERLVYGPPLGTGLAHPAFTPAGDNTTFVSHNTSWIASGMLATQHTLNVPYDDIILTFDQMAVSGLCLASIFIYIPAGFFYNSCQLIIIKHLSAAATVMLGSLRNITVWAACLMIPSVFGETFDIAQFIGFLFLLAGNVLFQRVWIESFSEVLPLPWVAACPVLFSDGNVEAETESASDVVIGAALP